MARSAACGRSARAASGCDGGFWGDRQALNRSRTIPHGHEQLTAKGTLHNLRLAAGVRGGAYQALNDSSGAAFPFLDTDVYKWLEALGWELGRGGDPALQAMADEAIGLIAAAQRPDGYLNSYVQVIGGGTPYRDLAWGHELYCIGHLVQAAVAWHRSLGDDRLLDIATRAADAVDRAFGPGGADGIDGHPEIEMALVELWRVTGERRYLDLARRQVDLRGHGLLGDGRFGREYWQDHRPVREAPAVAGHAVRQLYLDAGAVDVAVETGDRALLDAVIARWTDMVETRAYLTGGLGSRHRDEAFGDPFELPPDRAYAETCAAIASVMLGWRLLLATGEPRFADQVERTMFNGVLAGLSLDGTHFFYTNPLQRRSHRSATTHADGARAPWYPCACCPPNLMRTLASWEQYLATADDGGVQVHQYATAEIDVAAGGGRVRLAVETGYPWDGRVAVRVLETPDAPWTLSLRVPPGATSARLAVAGGASAGVTDRVAAVRRAWRPDDEVVLDLDLGARVTHPDRRVDATRGCVALERGPLVYAIESADLPDGRELEDVEVDPSVRPDAEARDDLAAGIVGLRLPARVRRGGKRHGAGEPIDLRADPVLRVGQPPGRGDAGLDPGPARRRDARRGRRRLTLRRGAARSTRGRPGPARTRPWPARAACRPARDRPIAVTTASLTIAIVGISQGRERRHRVGGDQDVVEADHRQPVRDVGADDVRGVERADRDEVGRGAHGGRRVGQLEQRPERLLAAGERVLDPLEVAVGDAAEALVHELDVRVLALPEVALEVGADERDPPVAEGDHVLQARADPGPVVRLGGRGTRAGWSPATWRRRARSSCAGRPAGAAGPACRPAGRSRRCGGSRGPS